MDNTYDVRIWKTRVYEGQRGNTYYVRWSIAGKERKEPFKKRALADSFRSQLLAAASKGEAFDVASGRPVTMARKSRDISWYEFACKYVDLKWPHVAATTRRTHAEALTAVTSLMLTTDRGKPDGKLIRKALCRWAFNTNRRNDPHRPAEIRSVLRWVEKHTHPVSDLADPQILRPILDGLTVRLDGAPAAPSVISRRRKILNAAVEYAVELKLLPTNPMPALKWKAPRPVMAVDPRSVPNPMQARTLLDAVREHAANGPRLVAFFGCLYYGALRPEEAVSLAKPHLDLPPKGWGRFHLDIAEPHAGKEWTNTGTNRDRRQLKQRARGVVRTVPCPPELTALIWQHVERFGYGEDGRLFVGERNRQELPKLTITRTWKRARERPSPRTWPPPRSPRLPMTSDMLPCRPGSTGSAAAKVADWAGQSIERSCSGSTSSASTEARSPYSD